MPAAVWYHCLTRPSRSGRDDRPERYGYQPDSSFYVDGMFTMSLAEGKYSMYLSKGTEYVDQYHIIKLAGGESKELEYEMKKWISMADSGWYSADDHIHIRRSPRETPLGRCLIHINSS